MDILHALPGRNLGEKVEEELVQQCLATFVVVDERELAIIFSCCAVPWLVKLRTDSLRKAYVRCKVACYMACYKRALFTDQQGKSSLRRVHDCTQNSSSDFWEDFDVSNSIPVSSSSAYKSKCTESR